MKIKRILKISSALMVMTLFLSSCNSSIQVAKKRHSNGYYVSIGGGNYESKAKAVEKTDLTATNQQTKKELVTEKIKSENTQFSAANKNSENVSQKEALLKKNTVVNQLTTSKKASAKKRNKISRIKKAVEIKTALKNSQADNTSDVGLLLLVIIAILLPPLAVFLVKGLNIQFWISLILTLLFWIPGLIYALLIVLGAI